LSYIVLFVYIVCIYFGFHFLHRTIQPTGCKIFNKGLISLMRTYLMSFPAEDKNKSSTLELGSN